MLAVLLLAGCTTPENAQTASVQLGVIQGTVTDPGLSPVRGASVVLDGANKTAITDESGAFKFEVQPNEYLVLATSPGYRGEALRARPEGGASVKLAFVLTPLPSQSPTIDVSEAHGLLSCALALKQSTGESSYACGGQDPNERKTLAFPVPSMAGLESVVIELVWDPTSKGANMLWLTLYTGDGEGARVLAKGEGSERVSLLMPRRVIEDAALMGQDLRALVEPAGSLTDEEAALDAGFTFQQPFTVYASLFYHAAAPSGYAVGS